MLRMMSIAEVAAAVGCTSSAVRTAIKRGQLRGMRIGARMLVHPSAVEAWLCPASAPQPASGSTSGAANTSSDTARASYVALQQILAKRSDNSPRTLVPVMFPKEAATR